MNDMGCHDPMLDMEKLPDAYDNGHWEWHRQMSFETAYGFIYEVVNTITGQRYLGKKNYRHMGKSRKLKSTGKQAQMNWRAYTGSSEKLNDDIQEHGIDKFRFFVIAEYHTKGGLNWGEIWSQTYREIPTRKLPSGDRMYYNRVISACKWIPTEEITQEHKDSIKRLK